MTDIIDKIIRIEQGVDNEDEADAVRHLVECGTLDCLTRHGHDIKAAVRFSRLDRQFPTRER